MSDDEHAALRSGFLVLVRRFAVRLREEGATEACAVNRLRAELDDSLMPFSVRHHCDTLVEEAEQTVAGVFARDS